MKPLWWMIGAATASWLALTAVVGDGNPEYGLGMVGPLVSAAVTWVLVRRTAASPQPERVTGVLIKALAGKMVFFGVYVIVMVRVLSLRPIPFMASFTGYFIALYVME